MLAVFLIAGVIAAVVTAPLVVEVIAGGALFGFFIALAHGDFGAAITAVLVILVVCWRWSRPGLA
jgi:hypothetical protein